MKWTILTLVCQCEIYFKSTVLRKVDWYLLFPILQDIYSKRISVLIETMAKRKASILAVILLRSSPGKCQKCEFSFCKSEYNDLCM